MAKRKIQSITPEKCEKPDLVFLVKKAGNKTLKVELFDAAHWDYWKYGKSRCMKYRIRANGVWFGEKGKGKKPTVFSLYEARDIMFRTINAMPLIRD